MVGHLNKKPFACSVCKYRSNWRWDITKHIRLKEARDATHANAKTLMTDETGRRNYSKYNLDMLWLRIAEPDPDNLQSMLSVIKPVTGSQTTDAGVGQTHSNAGTVLPAPPKLTRAPTPRMSTQSSTLSTPGGLLRPPPPLQAAGGTQNSTQVVILQTGMRIQGQQQSPLLALPQQNQPQPQQSQLLPQPQQSLKRPADSPVPKVGSDPKKSNTDIKKTVWRCKQCHFRDGDRAVVLTHVKGHYRQQQEAALVMNINLKM